MHIPSGRSGIEFTRLLAQTPDGDDLLKGGLPVFAIVDWGPPYYATEPNFISIMSIEEAKAFYTDIGAKLDE